MHNMNGPGRRSRNCLDLVLVLVLRVFLCEDERRTELRWKTKAMRATRLSRPREITRMKREEQVRIYNSYITTDDWSLGIRIQAILRRRFHLSFHFESLHWGI